jgi:hypothetical protein
MNIILFTPGACGDIVTAVIDSTGAILPKYNPASIIDYAHEVHYVLLDMARQKLKSECDLSKYNEYDLYINEMRDAGYLSLPSHSFKYHLDNKHQFILIDNSEDSVAEWVINRLNLLYGHLPSRIRLTESDIKYEIQRASPHTDKIINLRDIIEGRLITKLKQWIDTPLNDDLYQQWLQVTNYYYPL